MDKKISYIVPEEILTSREDYIKNWDTIDKSVQWEIIGLSNESHEKAREDLIKKAKIIGTNALTNVKVLEGNSIDPVVAAVLATSDYAGAYALFNLFSDNEEILYAYSGIPTNVAQENPNGKTGLDELEDIDNKLKNIKTSLIKKGEKEYIRYLRKAIKIFLIMIVPIWGIIYGLVSYSGSHIGAGNIIAMGIASVVISFFIVLFLKIYMKPKSSDNWLVRIA